MFGNGLSSSPSNVGPPHDRGRFPSVTLADNVSMQYREFDRTPRCRAHCARLRMVDGRPAGLPLGGIVSQHCGAHRGCLRQCPTAPRNQVFLEGIKYALMAGPQLARRPFCRTAGAWTARDGPDLCRLGVEPGLLSRRALSPYRFLFARRFLDCRLGGQLYAP